jgi:UDP-3-O-[3-hydroxymyristoyl] glucosamine N-acyltransferase
VSQELADVNPEDVPTRVVCPDSRLALAELLEHWHPLPDPEPGIHPTAVLGKGVELGTDVSVGPYCVVGDYAVLESGVVLDAHVCVGTGARIGAGSRLHPQVVLYPNVALGERVILHAGVRLGVDGFGYVLDGHRHRKVPQVGRCLIEDDVEIGANTCIDRGSIGDTVVERGSKLDNLVHLAHNVRVGSMSLLAAMVGIAGSSRVGRGVAMGGQVGISGHLEIGDGARLGAQSGIIGDVPAGETVSGYPARRHKDYLRAMGHVFRLPALSRRVKALEGALDRLQADSGDDH